MIVIKGTLVGGIVSAQGIGIPDAIAILSQEKLSTRQSHVQMERFGLTKLSQESTQ
jgi:S-adenosylmethionine synthetase